MSEVRLRGTMSMDDTQFHAALRRASTATGKFASQVGGLLKGAALTGITTAATAAAAAMAGLAASIKRGLEVGGKFNDLSKRIGDTAGRASLLATAFDAAGIGGDQLGTVINKMQKSIEGGSDAFVALGINLDELKRQTPTQQFETIGNKIAQIQDPAKRAATAMEIFGKSGGQLLQIFGDGGALEAARKTLGSMPDILDKNIEKLDDMGDKVGGLSAKWDAFSVGITSGLAPVLGPLLDKMIAVDTAKFGQALGQDIANAFEGQSTAGAITDLAGRFIRVMSAAALSLGDVIGAALTSAFSDPIATFQANIESLIDKAKSIIPGAPKALTPEEESRRQQLDKETKDIMSEMRDPAKKSRYNLNKFFLQDKLKEKADLDQRAAAAGYSNESVADRKKRILESGVRTGFGNGMTADERMQKAMDRISKVATENFPKAASVASGEIKRVTGTSSLPVKTAQSDEWNKPWDHEESSYSKMLQRANSSRVQGYSGGSIGIKGDPASVLRQPSRLVGGVRRRGETREEFKERMSGKKKEDMSIESNTLKTAMATEQLVKIWEGG